VWLLLQSVRGGYKINLHLQVQRFQQKREILQTVLPKPQVQVRLPAQPPAQGVLKGHLL
jgi:hypothetical protein